MVGPYQLDALDFEEFNDKMKCVKLYEYDESDLSDARVTVYGKPNFAGPYGGTLPTGAYTSADLLSNHIDLPGNEFSARGLRVPAGLTAQMFIEDYF